MTAQAQPAELFSCSVDPAKSGGEADDEEEDDN